MIKVLWGIGICLPMVALSAPAAKISEQIKISTVIGCPVAQLRLENHSRTTVYVDDIAPMLSVVDESGVSAKYLFSPASYNPDISVTTLNWLAVERTFTALGLHWSMN